MNSTNNLTRPFFGEFEEREVSFPNLFLQGVEMITSLNTTISMMLSEIPEMLELFTQEEIGHL
jgi:hypothetical protein